MSSYEDGTRSTRKSKSAGERSSKMFQSEYPQLRKQYWGQHLWARGDFCATAGTITDEMIKNYIEKHDVQIIILQ